MKEACTAGAYDNTGKDTVLAPCGGVDCAVEDGTCACTGDVFYGVDSRWVVKKSVAGSTACSNSAFITDPARGTAKRCMCKTSIPGSYVTALCTKGTSTAVGSNLSTTQCTVAQSGQYISKVCDLGGDIQIGSNTVIQPCTSTIPDGYFISEPCKSGSTSEVGSDTIFSKCTVASEGNFIESICKPGNISSAGSDSVVQSCTSVQAGSYVFTKCSSGSLSAEGVDTVIKSCSDISQMSSTSFVTKLCTQGSSIQGGGNDLTWKQCCDPRTEEMIHMCTDSPNDVGNTLKFNGDSGYYISKVCSKGSATQVGQNSFIEKCSTVPDESYITNYCKVGNINDLGSNVKFSTCTNSNSNSYVSNICDGGDVNSRNGADTQFKLCSNVTFIVNESAKYTTNICINGDYKTLGLDTQFSNCVLPKIDNGLTKMPLEYVNKTCILGDIYTIGSSSVVSPWYF